MGVEPGKKNNHFSLALVAHGCWKLKNSDIGIMLAGKMELIVQRYSAGKPRNTIALFSVVLGSLLYDIAPSRL